MRIATATALALILAVPTLAQIRTPDRPVTDPASLVSPVNPRARPVPLDDIGNTRTAADPAWSMDGKSIFVAINLTGRTNIWRTELSADGGTGGWPVQMTQSDDAQTGLVASRDGKWVYFHQDKGGDEYDDIFRVPVAGGAVEQVTTTPDIREGDLLPAPSGDIVAITTKRKSEGQTNLAVLENGKVRNLTAETDAAYSWLPVAWIEGGKALIVNRSRVDYKVGEVWRVELAGGKATKLIGEADTVYEASDATADGRRLAVSTNERTGQTHAGLYDVGAAKWRWLKPTVWEQNAGPFTRDGHALIVRTNDNARVTLYRVDLTTMAEAPLPLPPGVAAVAGIEPLSRDGSQLLIGRSAADEPGNLYRLDLASGRLVAVTQNAMASLTRDILPRSQVITYPSFDGTLVSAVVTMPYNLKRDGSNPAIVVPHGGPTGQTIDNFGRLATALASRGYIVIAPNFRGSTGYGKAFQDANFKDLGGGDLKDTVAAKTFLVQSGYVDPKRVGIVGGSYGGFMTLMAIGRVPDEFAAAVQWFGIINWRTMYRDQDELLKAYQRGLIGTPEADPKVYDAVSPLTYIRNAKAPLLSLQGENDIRVPRGQAQEVNDILKAKGNVVETVFYPAEGHGFQKRETQLDSLKRTVAWFDKYLKPAGK